MVTELESLFLHTLDELERRISGEEPYEILSASALIRKLFLDESPLVDQVNRNYKEKIRFEIGMRLVYPTDEPQPIFSTVQDGLDPDTAITGKKCQQVSRDQFLKTTVIVVNGQEYSIRDVILFEANIMGGVHAGAPKNEKEEVMRQLNQFFSVGGYRSSLRQLKAIGRVVLKALKPLRIRVEQ